MSDAPQPVSLTGEFHAFTFFGTELRNSERDDWLEHGQLSSSASGLMLQFREDGSSTRFRKVTPRPRMLPDFTVNQHASRLVSLRCRTSYSGREMTGRYMAAVPDGRIEIDREHTAAWETFFLISNPERESLRRFLSQTRIISAGAKLDPMILGSNFLVEGAGRQLPLLNVLAALDRVDAEGPRAFSLHDVHGRLVDLIQQ